MSEEKILWSHGCWCEWGKRQHLKTCLVSSSPGSNLQTCVQLLEIKKKNVNGLWKRFWIEAEEDSPICCPKSIGFETSCFTLSFSRHWRFASIIAEDEKGRGSWVMKAPTDFHLECKENAVFDISPLFARSSLWANTLV